MTRAGALALVVVAAASGGAACGDFENPSIVIDLRVLGMQAEPPEQVVPFDTANPPTEPPTDPSELGLVDVEVCALIAEPGQARRLQWEMVMCAETEDLRCDPERIVAPVAAGVIEDPDLAPTAQLACGTIEADAALLLVIQDAVSVDDLAGFGGIDVMVSLKVWPEGSDGSETDGPDRAVYAAKLVRVSAQVPPERTANQNPSLERIDILVADGERDPVPLPLGRCATIDEPVRIAAGGALALAPIEPEGAREDYVVPTFDGDVRMFTEVLSYQWLATAGSWRRESTGGGRDASGLLPPLDTEWRAPARVDEETDVTLWVIQRDERLGQRWYETCVRVVP